MIKVTDLETKLYVEQIYGEACDVYLPETFSEWEMYESGKQEVYNAMWTSVQTFWDVWEMDQRGLFSEAAPTRGEDDNIREVPDVARKKVLISKKMAYLGLPQVPRQAAVGLLANNMVSSNPDYYRYIGKGFFGALQDRNNGQEPQNWVKEIRYVLQGRPSTPWIIDPETGKPIPRLGAVTNRPIKEGVPQVPPAWNEYAPRKANGFQDEKTGQSYHGVYIGYQDTIKQLETPLGQRIQLTGGGERTTRDGVKIKTDGRGMTRGQVGADLRPPVGKDIDPNANAYLGTPATDDEPATPPMAAGYKPQSLATSNAMQRQFGQYKYYMMQNPELFDQRLANVLKRKYLQYKGQPNNPFTPEKRGTIPLHAVPLTRNVARTTPYDPENPNWGRARTYDMVPDPENPGKMKRVPKYADYYRRMWVPDPTEPGRQMLAPPEKREYTPEELAAQVKKIDAKIVAAAKEIKRINGRVVEIEKQYGGDQARLHQDDEYNTAVRDIEGLRGEIAKLQAQRQTYQDGKRVDFKPKQTGKFGSERIPYTPEEEKEIRDTGMYNGKKVGNVYKFIKAGKLKRDEEGKTIPRPTMGAVRQVVLPNNYFLSPVQGDPIVLSPEVRDAAMKVQAKLAGMQKGEETPKDAFASVIVLAERGQPGDKVFAKYLDSYGLRAQKDGTFVATTLGEEAGKIPWSWARTDDKGNLLFSYKKDKATRNIPIYLPGVIDDRKPGNPTTAGGFDSAPANAPETRPIRDPRTMHRALHGVDPESGKRIFEGWNAEIQSAAESGVKAGLAELLKRQLRKAVDPYGNTDKNHYQYLFMARKFNGLVRDSEEYLKYNLRNSKALDFYTNSTGYMDRQYIRRQFPALYAAVMKFDQWFNSRLPNGKTVKQALKIPKRSLWDMTFPQLAEFMARARDFTEIKEKGEDGSDISAGFGSIGHVKIDARYIKKGLKDFKMDDPYQHQYTGSNTTKSYGKLALSVETLEDLFSEARRNYWEFAAKDMVIKVWQHTFAPGKAQDVSALLQDDEDGEGGGGMEAALLGIAGSGKNQAGRFSRKGKEQGVDAGSLDDTGANDQDWTKGGDLGDADDSGGGPGSGEYIGNKRKPGEQIHGRLRLSELIKYVVGRQKKLTQAYQQIDQLNTADPLDHGAAQIALKFGIEENNARLELLKQLKEEASKMRNKTPQQQAEWIEAQYPLRLPRFLELEEAKNTRMAAPEQGKDTEAQTRTLDDFYKQAQEKGVSTAPVYQKIANELLNSDARTMGDELERVVNFINDHGTPKERMTADRSISYIMLKKLQQMAPTMTPKQKLFFTRLANMAAKEYSTLIDVEDLISQIIPAEAPTPEPQADAPAQAAPEPAAPPKASSGLGGRLRRNTA